MSTKTGLSADAEALLAAKGANLEKIAEIVEKGPPEEFPGEERLYPTLLPPNWKRLRFDPTGMGFKGIYLSRCGLNVLMSVARQLDGKWWLHVSLNRRNQIPSYKDITEVKRLFIGDNKTAIQVFPPRAKHVNISPTTLHLWHCLDGDVTPDFTQGTGSI